MMNSKTFDRMMKDLAEGKVVSFDIQIPKELPMTRTIKTDVTAEDVRKAYDDLTANRQYFNSTLDEMYCVIKSQSYVTIKTALLQSAAQQEKENG